MKTLSTMRRCRTDAFAQSALAGLALFFALPPALPANDIGIAVNGVCQHGSCPAIPEPFNTTVALPVTFTFTLANGDTYLVTGSSTESNNGDGSNLPVNTFFQVTYQGNQSGGASAADTFTFDWYNAFQTLSGGSGNFGWSLEGVFGPTISATSSVSDCVNGSTCAGPVAPPGSFNIGFSDTENSANNAFAFDFSWSVTFGAGSPAGSYIFLGPGTLPPQATIASFSPASGTPGATVTIKGTNFTGTTAVTFNGVPAAFVIVSAAEISATAPAGATSGPIQVAASAGIATSASNFTATSVYTFVPIPGTNNIQNSLISTFPAGIFTANNLLATPFSISATPGSCGYTGTGACNFNDAFGYGGSGQSITIDVSIPKVTHVYTLMNAYGPPAGEKIATIKFVGSKGATQTFSLISGENIRDFYQGGYTNTLNNGVLGVSAMNAFTCVSPNNCLGAGGTGDVGTGEAGTYEVDEQEFVLSAPFATQNLTQIVITDTLDGTVPILLGITAQSK
jgi:IPT/TIG domain-containing protein